MATNLLNNRRIAKNTVYLYLRMLVAMALGIYTSRLVLEALGETDFGIYNVVGGVVVFLNFLNGTLVAGTQRYINIALGSRSEDYYKDVIHASRKNHLILSLVVVVLAEVIGLWVVNHVLTIPDERMLAANVVYQSSILAIFFSINQSPLQAVVIAQEKMQYYAAISIFDMVAKFGCAIFLLYSTYDTLIVYGVVLAVIAWLDYTLYYNICRRKFIGCIGKHTVTDKSIYKSMLFFSGWTTIGSLAGVLLNQGINMLLNVFAGPVVNAARGLAVTLNGYVYSFVNNFTVAFSPQLIKLYASNEYEVLSELLTRSIKYSVYLYAVFALPVLFETEFVLNLWLKEVPDFTVVFCKIVVCGSFISCAERPMSTVCNAIGCVKQVNLSVGVIYLLAFGLSWLMLYLTRDVVCPFLIYVAVTFVGILMFLHYIHKHIGLSRRHFLLSIIGQPVVTLAIPVMLLMCIHQHMQNGWARFLVIGIVSTVSVIVFSYVIGLGNTERKKINHFIKLKLCCKK